MRTRGITENITLLELNAARLKQSSDSRRKSSIETAKQLHWYPDHHKDTFPAELMMTMLNFKLCSAILRNSIRIECTNRSRMKKIPSPQYQITSNNIQQGQKAEKGLKLTLRRKIETKTPMSRTVI